MSKLKKARDYVKNNTISSEKKCSYHLTPETGWMNDPNGFSFFGGKYHMFYQFYPYKASWACMHWGHATTEDFIKWEYAPVALAPKLPGDTGKTCYSGGAIEKDGEHYLIYTENYIGQRQCIAKSKDGIEYSRHSKYAISGKQLPNDMSVFNFRDPKVWKKDDTYYCLAGCKGKRNDGCNVLLFKSKDLYDWDFVGKLFDKEFCIKNFGKMVECPDFFHVDGKDVVIVSPWRWQQVYYFVGELDYATGKFVGSEPKLVDHGTDFFATQSITAENGDTHLTAWAQPTVAEGSVMQKFGWNGVFTLPRVVHLNGDTLLQNPPQQLKKYRGEKFVFSGKVEGQELIKVDSDKLDVELKIKNVDNLDGVTLYADEEGNGLKIYYSDGKLVIDRKQNYEASIKSDNDYVISADINLAENDLSIRVILDRFILEVFVGEGETAFSTLVSPSSDRLDLMLTSKEQKSEFELTAYKLR